MSTESDNLLARLGADLGADRVVLHWHRQGIIVVADQWHSDRCEPLPPSAGVPADASRRWLRQLSGGSVLRIDDVSGMDDDWAAERAVLRSAGAAAVVGVAVRDHSGAVVGNLAVHDGEPREWTAIEVDAVGDVAALLASRADQEVARTSAVATAGFDTLPVGLVVFDAEGTAIAANAAARSIGVRPGHEPRAGLDGVTDLGPHAARLIGQAIRPLAEGRTTTATTDVPIYGVSVPIWFQRVGDGDDAEILAVVMRPDQEGAEGKRVAQLVEAGHVAVAYQPLLDPAGGLLGFEVLCRPDDPASGPIAPADFVERAERSGAVPVLDGWVFRRAAEQFRALAGTLAVEDLFLSVNLSAESLLSGFTDRATAVCEAVGVTPSSIQFELTETELLYDPRGIAELTSLARAGFSLALDDFGSGYSSFAYLAELPVHAVKLDRSLVVAGAADDRARRVAQGVCRMARDLGLRIYAEGIETERERRLVWELGCDGWQGFLCARPQPIDDIVAMLEAGVDRSRPRLLPPMRDRAVR